MCLRLGLVLEVPEYLAPSTPDRSYLAWWQHFVLKAGKQAGKHCLCTWWVSARPISTGPPQCLMEDTGEAPVPPSWPLIWMTSALALATPLATVPMPA